MTKIIFASSRPYRIRSSIIEVMATEIRLWSTESTFPNTMPPDRMIMISIPRKMVPVFRWGFFSFRHFTIISVPPVVAPARIT